MQAKIGTLSLEGQALLEKDTAKKEAKAEAKALAEAKKKEVCKLLPVRPPMRPEPLAGVDSHYQTDTTEQEQVRDVDTRTGSLRYVM